MILCCRTPIETPTQGAPTLCPDCFSILAIDPTDFAMLEDRQLDELAAREAAWSAALD